MNVLLAGQKRFGREVLELILARRGWRVVAASCPPTRRDGSADPLWCAVERHRIPWIAPGNLRANAVPEGTDLIVAAHCHDYLGRATRLRARLGAVGYHPSLLPRHRGRSAVHWAIQMREPVTGGSIYWLNETVDGGPVAAQRHVQISKGETASKLWAEKLLPLGLELFTEVFDALDRGELPATPQDTSLATWEPAYEGAPALYRPELPMIGG